MHKGRKWPRRLDTLILGYINPPMFPTVLALPKDAILYYDSVNTGFTETFVGPTEITPTDGLYTYGTNQVHYAFNFTPILLPTQLDIWLILDQTFNYISHWEWQWTQAGVPFERLHGVLQSGKGWEGPFGFNPIGPVWEEVFSGLYGFDAFIAGHYYDGSLVHG